VWFSRLLSSRPERAATIDKLGVYLFFFKQFFEDNFLIGGLPAQTRPAINSRLENIVRSAALSTPSASFGGEQRKALRLSALRSRKRC
jgi:hypothetical protein